MYPFFFRDHTCSILWMWKRKTKYSLYRNIDNIEERHNLNGIELPNMQKGPRHIPERGSQVWHCSSSFEPQGQETEAGFSWRDHLFSSLVLDWDRAYLVWTKVWRKCYNDPIGKIDSQMDYLLQITSVVRAIQDKYEEEFQMTQQFNLIPQTKIMTSVFHL